MLPKKLSLKWWGLVNEAQFNKVLEYVKIEKEEDAKVVYGGEKIVENGSNKGYFIESTIFIDVYNNMRIAQKTHKMMLDHHTQKKYIYTYPNNFRNADWRYYFKIFSICCFFVEKGANHIHYSSPLPTNLEKLLEIKKVSNKSDFLNDLNKYIIKHSSQHFKHKMSNKW